MKFQTELSSIEINAETFTVNFDGTEVEFACIFNALDWLGDKSPNCEYEITRLMLDASTLRQLLKFQQ
jgi:hypothetical protein